MQFWSFWTNALDTGIGWGNFKKKHAGRSTLLALVIEEKDGVLQTKEEVGWVLTWYENEKSKHPFLEMSASYKHILTMPIKTFFPQFGNILFVNPKVFNQTSTLKHVL